MTAPDSKQQHFHNPTGSVDNRGTQHNVAGKIEGNQIDRVETLNQNQDGIQQTIADSPHSTVQAFQGDNNRVAGRDYIDVKGDFYQAPPPLPTGIPHNLPLLNATVFVGRDDELTQLHQQLEANECVAITAIAGMGGIGKSELALRYAYLQAERYPAGLCWFRARGEEIGSQITLLAQTRLNLNLPEGLDLAGQVAYCWSRWPQGNALIVVDDVTDYEAIAPYLPSDRRFKLLLTSRLKLGPSFHVLNLEVLQPEPALDLLRSLAGAERIEAELEAAKALCNWLGYLPLGLELVGRYLQSKPDLSLKQLQQRLEAQQLAARALCKTDPGMTAQLGVAAAFELSWQELSPDAQKLGCLLALFAAAPIPWALVEQAVQHLPKPTPDNETLEDWRDEELIYRHLLQRQGQGSYQLHPLLRQFFASKGEALPQQAAQIQAVCRTLVVVARTIPQTPTLSQIAEVEPCLPHLEEVARQWHSTLSDEDWDWPFIGLGRFWEGQGLYAQAEPWYQQCLEVARQRFGNASNKTATSLNNLALLYRSQGRYEDAEPLYGESLEIRRRVLGDDHPDTAISAGNLAGIYEAQGLYAQAEPLCIEALQTHRKALGNDHPHTATSLNNLAALYYAQGRYGDAKPFYGESLEIRRRVLGDDHPDTATSLNNLAALYQSQGCYGGAEPLYGESLEIRRRVLGDDHLDTATSLNNLATLYESQGRYGDAEPLLTEALAIFERMLGTQHPTTVTIRNNLQQLRRPRSLASRLLMVGFALLLLPLLLPVLLVRFLWKRLRGRK